MAGIRINEPRPRERPLGWSPFILRSVSSENLVRPVGPPVRTFSDVLEGRRSAVGASIDWPNIADLLWYAAGQRGFAESGRAGSPIGWSPTPSSGGLHCVQIFCISDDASPPKLYDPIAHRFLILTADGALVREHNRREVYATTGAERGCTLRLVGDWSKLSAAYEHAETLLYRDAGCLAATVCLCAEWLWLTACPLGFLGDALLPLLGLPAERFRAVGAVQIGKR